MSNHKDDGWSLLLSRLNALVLKSEQLKSHITEEIRSASWCGRSPATEELISNAERRLGIRLPPSYRNFLSVANGWYLFSSSIEQLLSICEIDWLRFADPDGLAAIQKHYREDEISDQEYLDYETNKHMEALRHRYYPDCLLVGKGWTGEGVMVLLNSKIVFSN